MGWKTMNMTCSQAGDALGISGFWLLALRLAIVILRLLPTGELRLSLRVAKGSLRVIVGEPVKRVKRPKQASLPLDPQPLAAAEDVDIRSVL